MGNNADSSPARGFSLHRDRSRPSGEERALSLVFPWTPSTCMCATEHNGQRSLRPGSCVHVFKVTQPLPEPQSRHLALSQCFPGPHFALSSQEKGNSDSNITLTKSYRKMKCSKSYMKMNVSNRICFPFRHSEQSLTHSTNNCYTSRAGHCTLYRE